MLELLNVVKMPALNHELSPGLAPMQVGFKSGSIRQFQQPGELAGHIAERRSKVRYPIELDVRFLPSKNGTYNTGRTVNISSSGLLISSASIVGEGTALHIMIQWPYTLDGRIPLQLVAAGVVVRSTPSLFAVTVKSYQFRTMKQHAIMQTTLTARARG
jgi:hypothetical protein